MCAGNDTAWASLTMEARNAAASQSAWGRYGVPYDAIERRLESDTALPPPDLAAFDIPDDMRMAIKSMDQMIQGSGILPEPCEAWIGLKQPSGTGHSRFEVGVGEYFCLVGIVSASLLPEPAIFAAGREGALLRVRLQAALPMVGDLEKPGEMELVPPRNSCYKIEWLHVLANVTDSKGRQWRRMVIEATQI